jgi:hypothetical protein
MCELLDAELAKSLRSLSAAANDSAAAVPLRSFVGPFLMAGPARSAGFPILQAPLPTTAAFARGGGTG